MLAAFRWAASGAFGDDKADTGAVRRPTHAGSWYEDDRDELRSHVQQLLGAEYAEGVTADPNLKAMIAPHAGLRFSGAVAAAVYARVEAGGVRRVFLLGPSHHARIQGCGLPEPGLSAYGTPLGDLPLDLPTLEELRRSGMFSELPRALDEAEHSLELQLPFLAQLLLHNSQRGQTRPATLIPMLVGRLGPKEEAAYGRLLAPHFEAEGNLFIVSSDFCHWGAQFGYTRTGSPAMAEVYRQGPWPENAAIEGLDREGMTLITRQDSKGFREYLARDANTICGRHPILVLLETLQACRNDS
jgi:AmmeMemoRadiSam system protein B